MPDEIRRSIFTRLIALGFIFLVILGNWWFAQLALGQAVSQTLIHLFVGAVVWVFTWGFCLGVQWIHFKYFSSES